MEVIEFGLADDDFRARYDQLFEACPDAVIQQSSWWAEVVQDLGPDRPILLICQCEDEAIAGLPLYLFESHLGKLLTSVPQAGPIGGVFCYPNLTAEETDQAYALLLAKAGAIAEREGCFALSIVTNPFRQDLAYYRRYLEPNYTFENFAQYIPLDTGIVEGRVQMKDSKTRKHLYQDLRRAADAGCVVDTLASDSEFARCYEIHHARYTEIGAQPLDRRLLENIVRLLGPRGKARFQLVKCGGEIASGALLIYHSRVIDLFSISMNIEYEPLAPNRLNLSSAMHWAKRAGLSIFNWQSSPARGDGVYAFKRLWGSIEKPFYYVSRLFVPPEQIQAWGREKIGSGFPGHFVVPFGMLTDPGQAHFRK